MLARNAAMCRALRLTSLGGALAVLGLLSYPLPAAWLGLAALAALTAARWYSQGRPFPATPFNGPIGAVSCTVSISPPDGRR